MEYIQTEESNINLAMSEKEKDRLILDDCAQGFNISNNDRFRFIEAILSDYIKILYSSSQELISFSELDNIHLLISTIK